MHGPADEDEAVDEDEDDDGELKLGLGAVQSVHFDQHLVEMLFNFHLPSLTPKQNKFE